MNKKGFTLVEVIVIVGILALATLVISSNLIRMNNRQKDIEYERIVSKIKTSAETYVRLDINEGFKEQLKSNPDQVFSITLSTLVEEGVLDDERLIDPRGNIEIPLTNVVKVKYDSVNKEYSFDYDYE